MVVSNGGTADYTLVKAGGRMVVSHGGTVTSTTLSGTESNLVGWAQLIVDGQATSTMVTNGLMIVNSATGRGDQDGVVYYTFVNSGGNMNINSRCVAFSNTVNDGGVIKVNDSGRATYTQVNSGGRLEVSSGGLAYDATVNSGGTMTVFEGGKAYTDTVVNAGGWCFVCEGGTANSVTVNHHGELDLFGGVVNTVTLDGSAAYLYVMSGGVANDIVVNNQAQAFVYSGGTAVNAAFDNGYAIVNGQGTVINSATIANWGWVQTLSGGTANFTTVNSLGGLLLSEGGYATSTTVNSGGFMNVYYGGVGNYATISSGGTLNLRRGGFMNYATVRSGGSAVLVNGTVYVKELTVNGELEVRSGGSMDNLSNELILGSGATLMISGGGYIAGTVVGKGAQVTVEGGAVLRRAEISGGRVITKSGAYLENVYLNSSSILEAGSGASLNFVQVKSGAVLTGVVRNAKSLVFSGGTLDLNIAKASENDDYLIDSASYSQIKTGTYDVTLSIANKQMNGAYKLITGATGFNKTITVKFLNNNLGTLTVNGGPTNVGGVVCDLTLTSGDLVVTVTGGAIPDPIYSSATLIDERKDITSGMSAIDIKVSSGGILNIYSSGIASNTTVYADGEFNLNSGGILRGATIYSGGTATVYEDTRAQNVHVMNGGTLVVESDAFITYTSGGKLVSSNVYVELGGKLEINGGWVEGAVLSGGDAVITGEAGSMFKASVTKGDVLAKDGGFAGMTILESGVVTLASGGTGSCTVSSGGTMRLEDGSDLHGLRVYEGGVVTGVMHGIYSVVTFYNGTLDLDISGIAPSNEYLIDMDANLDFSHGMSCTLTVNGYQENGTYKLMESAYEYDTQVITAQNPLTVKGTDGSTLGTLTVGKTAYINGANYTLNLSADNHLTVTVEGATPPPPPEPMPKWTFFAGDFAGESLDRLAVETLDASGTRPELVTVYINGEAWGLGLTLDPGWNVVGTGDFSGDGIDDFLRVNTEGYVVGEMSNGNGTFTPQVLNLKNAGWDILGTGDFNGNGTSDVLIANPTAASDTVGLLGYWESGVSWTLINGYSPEWTMVSTGDFNGDGKCDMLWKNEFIGEGGLTYNAYCTWIVEDPVDWRMVSVANPAEWNFLCSGDFDGNGSHDIAMINDVGVVGIWGVSDGYLSSWSILSAVTSEWTLAGVADFNADGTDDIAWANTDTGLTGYWQINNKELTTWANIVTLS